MRFRRLPVALLLISVAACAEDTVVSKGECVVLLHGMARTASSMDMMARSLEDSGYTVANIGYPSREHRIEDLAPMAIEDGIEACEADENVEKIHFVTHSLGGILVRQYFADNALPSMGRVVMLGPPNQGSNAADAMRNVPGFDWLNGPAGAQLGKGEESVPLKLGPPNFEVGIIAGNRTIDPITSATLENPDDGRVSVEDTKLEGMQDFIEVGASHAFMMQKKNVIALVKRFLETGSFDAA